MDQQTVCQVHCQGLLRNQTARFPKQRHYTNGYLWNTCSALQTQTFTSVLRWLKMWQQQHQQKKSPFPHSLLKHRKVCCRKNRTVWSVKVESRKINDIFMLICPLRLSSEVSVSLYCGTLYEVSALYSDQNKDSPRTLQCQSRGCQSHWSEAEGRGLASLGCSTDSTSSPKVDSDWDKRFTPILFSPEGSLP